MTDKVIMICAEHKDCFLDMCPHIEEHPAMESCDKECGDNKAVCFMAEFTPFDDVGDEEDIA